MLNNIRIGVAQVPPTPDLSKNLDKALEYVEKAATHAFLHDDPVKMMKALAEG